nr:helix-turn-helix domain-containing protein [Roseospira visakhapatnamensis]
MARLTDTKVDTIRYYERIGVLAAPARTSGNHRVYTREHLRRLSFVRGARRLGFTLDEVREMIALGRHAEHSCAEIHAVAGRHLEAVRGKITHLERLRDELAHMVDQCVGGRVDHCGILDALSHGGDAEVDADDGVGG